MAKILLFAGLKERVGQASLSWDETPISIGKLRTRLEKIEGMSSLEGVMIAINEVYAKEDDVVKADDTVALIPPVSGG